MMSGSNSRNIDLFANVLKTYNSTRCLKCDLDDREMLVSYYASRGLLLKHTISEPGHNNVDQEVKNNFDIVNVSFCENCLNDNYIKYIKKEIGEYSTLLWISLAGFILSPLILYSTKDGPIFGETVAGSGQGMSVLIVVFALILALFTVCAPLFVWKFMKFKRVYKNKKPITKISDLKKACARILTEGIDNNLYGLPELQPSFEMAKISHKKHLKRVEDENAFHKKFNEPELEYQHIHHWSYTVTVLSVSSEPYDLIPFEWIKFLKKLLGEKALPIQRYKRILYYISRDWMLIPISIVLIIAAAGYVYIMVNK